MPAKPQRPPQGRKELDLKVPGQPRTSRNLLLMYAGVIFLLLWFWQAALTGGAVRTISYSEFKQHVARNEVVECTIGEEEISGRIVPKVGAESGPSSDPNVLAAGEPFAFRTVRVEDARLVEQLEAAGVRFVGARPTAWMRFLLAWLMPITLLVIFWSFLARRIGAAGQSILSVGQSKARLVAVHDTGVSFEDVAGCDEAKFELQEVVEFLKHPDEYRKLGAKIPKGALLVGPPGTGKTLLARAIAGEARVPFFSLSGSEFVEMFVGVGAARVRDLFQQAKQHAPCIVFIDELDAIGRQRGVHIGVVNDEREQTLNQLLSEMDGFEPNTGVIILAATNRPEVLDRALLRPGRFDRQIVVDLPDVDGREAILKVHARGKPLAADVVLHRIAQATAGFSGADLANALNEAALLAVRRKAPGITQTDVENAVERVVAGPERKSRRLNDEQKRRVAHHEAGHALVAAHSQHADPVHKISIIPRGRSALGYTLQLPTEEVFLLSRADLQERLRVLLGGRAAEELIFGDVTTGAQNDLELATALARQMICLYGMSDALGLAHIAQRPAAFLSGPEAALQRDCSEQTAREVDEEVKALLDRAYCEAKEVLTLHRHDLETVAAELLRVESLDGPRFYELIGRPAVAKVEGKKAVASSLRSSPSPETTLPESTPGAPPHRARGAVAVVRSVVCGLLGCLTFLGVARAAVPGDEQWDDRFGPWGVFGTVGVIAMGTNEMIIGGNFTHAGAIPASNIARWNGRTWSALGSGLNSNVFAIAISGTNVYVGGPFTTAGGRPANRIARWDGQDWSPLGGGFNDEVRALAVSGNDLYAGGAFTNAGGANISRLAKWNGTSWSAVGTTLSQNVNALAVNGTDIYAGGFFQFAGLLEVNQIARWNGATWSALGTGLPNKGYVRAIAIEGGNVYVAGNFTNAGGFAATNIARWNGGSWSALGQGINSELWAVAARGTNVYAGGGFTQAGGVAATGVARWDGSTWSPLGTGIRDGAGGAIGFRGDDVYVGGNFSTTGDVGTYNIARWNGAQWFTLGSGMSFEPVYAVATGGTNIYVGGAFTNASGVAANRVARWNGRGWSVLGSGVNGPVHSLLVSEGDVYAGGNFTSAGSVPASRIARWDGETWSSPGTGFDAPVLTLARGNAGELYAGGEFTNAGAVVVNRVARWNGSNWTALGPGFNGPVRALAFSGTNLYAAGSFSVAGSVISVGVMKWNGSSWSALAGTGLNNGATALAVLGGDIYVGGFFTLAGGVPASYVVRWNGTNWSPVGSGLGNVVFTLAANDEYLYAGGAFTTASGVAANYIARWDGANWSALGSGTDSWVQALAVRGPDLLVGGGFGEAGGRLANQFTIWHGGQAVAPRITQFTSEGQDARIQFTTVPGQNYAVEWKEFLSAPRWTELVEGLPGDGATNAVLHPDGLEIPSRFYRISTTIPPWDRTEFQSAP